MEDKASSTESMESSTSAELSSNWKVPAVTTKRRANRRKNRIYPIVISTLIKSRQTPKLSLRAVRKVIKGRSRPIFQIFME